MPLTVWFTLYTLTPIFPIFATNFSFFLGELIQLIYAVNRQVAKALPPLWSLCQGAAAPFEVRIRLQLRDEVREAALQLQWSSHFLGAGGATAKI